MIEPTLAEKFDASKIDDWNAWVVSEKFDGVRAIWDGKTLWTRNGEKIYAPAFWTKSLPNSLALDGNCLDGELTMGFGTFEKTSGEVRRQEPDNEEWKEIRFKVFDFITDDLDAFDRPMNYFDRMQEVVKWKSAKYMDIVEQHVFERFEDVKDFFDDVIKFGGEGLMLRLIEDYGYQHGRVASLLKMKPFKDAEAVVCGHVEGTGRNAGRLGALLCEMPDGQTFRCGGMIDKVRDNPPDVGSVITYRYEGFTNNNKPRFPRFLRVRGDNRHAGIVVKVP